MFQIQKAVLKNGRFLSVYAVKTPKAYGYVRELQVKIVGKRLSSGVGNTHYEDPAPRRPTKAWPTLTNLSPPPTEELVEKQYGRGVGM